MSKKIQSSRGLLIFGICWTVFSSIFAIVGLVVLYNDYDRSGWPKTPCQISHFEISANPNSDPSFQPKVKYTYEWQGKTLTGDQVWFEHQGSDNYEDLSELIEQHRNGELKTCSVNPDDPTESVLIAAPGDAWLGMGFCLFGFGFVAIGIGLIFAARGQKKKESSALSSKKDKNEHSPVLAMLFFSIFGIAGLCVLVFLVIPQWVKYYEAKGWVATPAKVIWSRVESHTDDDGTTYSVDIFYRYEFQGKDYRSNTMGLISSSSSGHESKLEKVKANPPGKEITCYVNPDKPWQALLERDLGWWALLALFPLPFLGVGIGGFWWMLRKKLKSRNQLSSNRDQAANPYTRRSGLAQKIDPSKDKASIPARRTLKPGGKRVGWFFGSIAIAIFWNGITSVFVWQAVQSWQRGKPEWFLTIFIIPFVLVGIGFILHVFYRLLALFNPISTLTLTPGEITLGETAKLKWNSPGSAHRFRRFAIYLVGEEEAKYQRGTDTVTDTETFYEVALIDTQDPRKSMTGSARIELPSNAMNLMPTWKASNNRIRWSIHVKGEIAIWPDVSDKYEITVRPVDISS